MPPPPSPSTYPTLTDLMTACQTHARAHGYACVTSSNNYKRGIAYVRCDRGGHYANHWHLTPETRQRHNRTRRLVGCAWKARAKRLKSGEWELRMMVDRHSGHGPSGDAKAHPSLRKLDPAAVSVARGMFEQGRAPKEVLEELRRWNAAVTAQDVYNLKAKIAREENNGSGAAGDGNNTRAGPSRLGGGRNGSAATDPTDPSASTTTAPNPTSAVTDAALLQQPDADATADETVLDPALQMQGILTSTPVPPTAGRRAPPAQMQDPATLANAASANLNSGDSDSMDTSGPIAATAAAALNSNGNGAALQRGKCQCKCCDH